MMSPKIAIIGAGPGGCMLARLLTRHNISCTIFEADHSPDYRSQGGTLDLRAGTGLKAIQEAGLFESFQERARYDGESLVICDKKQTTWLRRYPSKQGEKNSIQEAPEIDRAALREMLMDSLPEGIVRWGHRLKSIGEDLSLRFENGNVETGFDLIVGADGAFSRTRSFLSSQQPMYTGLGGWSLSIPNAEVLAPDVYKLVNRGSVFCFSDGKNVNAQQLGDGSISVSYWSRFDEHYTSRCGFDPRDLGLVKQKLRGELHDWAPELKNLVEKAEGEPVWRNLYMLPVGFTWEHKCGVTLLGDAAHLMAPFAGIGVNTAFYDATLLADAIIDYTKSGKPENLDKHVIEYEEKMFALGHEAQRLTEGVMLDMQFTPGAPRTSIESYVLKFMYKEFPRWPRFLLKIAVFTIYAIYKLFV